MVLRKVISKVVFSFGILFFSIIPIVNSSYADFYSYVDQKGVHHYTNIPPTDKKYKLKWRTKKASVKPNGIYNYPKSYEEDILRAAKQHDVDPDLVKAVIKVESNFNSSAISRKGAMGIMQLMPDTAEGYSVDNPFNPKENIDGGTKYLKKLIEMFGGDLKLALAAYNAGENAVIKYGFRIPPYNETIDYVEKVLMHYNNLKENNGK
ncbi:MAG: lytic transglycosylase [Candidatus Dadabacteria bacterium CSP1-2]|nr:MAG: lytic transglycosylase [Candidatus Dadabacteria bacterium CSP1-2]